MPSKKEECFRGEWVYKLNSRGSLRLPEQYIRVLGRDRVLLVPSFYDISCVAITESRWTLERERLLGSLREETALEEDQIISFIGKFEKMIAVHDRHLKMPQKFIIFSSDFFNIKKGGDILFQGLSDYFSLSDRETHVLQENANFSEDVSIFDSTLGWVGRDGTPADVSPKNVKDSLFCHYPTNGFAENDQQEICVSAQRDIMRRVSIDASKLFHLGSRDFELLVADIFRAQGYTVKVTPASKDGGYDVLARIENKIRKESLIIECKRYRVDRPVGVEVVRSVLGSIEPSLCSAAVVITTSNFTSGANTLASSRPFNLSLLSFGRLMQLVYQARVKP